MNDVERIEDKARIAEYCRRDAHLHLYELGDLDPFFWGDTTWFGLRDEAGALAALALLYTGLELPTLLALSDTRGRPTLGALLAAIEPQLPRRFYAHLSPGLDATLGRGGRQLVSQGRHLKMTLVDHHRVADVDVSGVVALGPDDAAEARAFFDRVYPGNWFAPRMIETGCYFGIRDGAGDDRALLCVAGVHVFAPSYGVAALGNITTAPDYRGRGLARRAPARLCQALLERVDVIGLNVKDDNAPAIRCYERLGFEVTDEYRELMVER